MGGEEFRPRWERGGVKSQVGEGRSLVPGRRKGGAIPGGANGRSLVQGGEGEEFSLR